MSTPLRTVIVGFGKVGAGYCDDPVMARHYPYATHAQVLAAHPAFDWQAVVDLSDCALDIAATRWQVTHRARSCAELAQSYAPEVAVLATPPDSRIDLLSALPTLRAVLVEKPLGTTHARSEAFLKECERRGISVQVNLWRRADTRFRQLANGYMTDRIGQIQAIYGLYGNGLRNNGTHLIDFVRMLCGEVQFATVVPGTTRTPTGPLPDDLNVPVTLNLESGAVAMLQPLDFTHYRENGLEIWGTSGRLSILQEGLSIWLYPRCPHRATQDAFEVASDCPEKLETTVGHAFYEMFDNLAAHLNDGVALVSPGPSALRTTEIVEALMEQAR